MATGGSLGAGRENMIPVRSMRVDGPGTARRSMFSTKRAETMSIGRRGYSAPGMAPGDGPPGGLRRNLLVPGALVAAVPALGNGVAGDELGVFVANGQPTHLASEPDEPPAGVDLAFGQR